jgi:chromosome segregation protein
LEFKRLRLAGFKSFADAVEIELLPGLTGIIGPNGCGKSNLTEAMRWAMGEGRAGSVRAEAMDEVIFAGAAGRTARNIAEVTIALAREGESIEVTRRITRGDGSLYRLNGEEARQRDIQLLFADAATGSHAAALVGQGRIAAVIAARPAERRQMLEEAAGIAGLAVRRKEAEARLRAASTNLARVEDLGRELDLQVAGLKRQSRAAERHAELSGRIRSAQVFLLFAGWRMAAAQAGDARERAAHAANAVGVASARTAEAERVQSRAVDDSRTARDANARAVAAAEQCEREVEALAQARARSRQRDAELTAQSIALDRDLARETALADEGRAGLARSADEIARFEANAAALATEEHEAGRCLGAATVALPASERAMAEALEARALRAAEQSSLAERRETLRTALAQRSRELETIEREHRALLAISLTKQAPEPRSESIDSKVSSLIIAAECARVSLRAAEGEMETARTELAGARTSCERLRATLDTVQSEMDAGNAPLAKARAHLAAIEAEVAAFGERAEAKEGCLALSAAAGFERALVAGLGDDVYRPVGIAGEGWARIAPHADDPELPAGCASLGKYVTAPKELARRLAQVGVVESAEDGESLALRLAPGQRLVDREGALWRWDGFDQRRAGNGAAVARLSAESRLSVLRQELAAAHTILAPIEATAFDGTARRDAVLRSVQQAETIRARIAEQSLRAEARYTTCVRACAEAEARAARARAEAETRAARAEAEAEARRVRARDEEIARAGQLAAVDLARARAEEELSRAQTDLADAEARLGALPPVADAQARYDRALDAVGAQRLARDRATERLAAANRAQAEAARGFAAARDLLVTCDARVKVAQARLVDLAVRGAVLAKERADASVGDVDTEAAARRDAAQARAQANAAAASSAQLDAVAAAAIAALEIAREGHGATREGRAAAAAEADHAVRAVGELHRAISQAHDCEPSQLPNRFDFEPDDAPVDLREAELDRLVRERERLGAVNMRALVELEDARGRAEGLAAERGAVETAIARLRGSIGALNRDGRVRLLATFGGVDRRFRQLFATLFEGGEAKLALIDSDDVLDAGLEITAKPPGKAAQSLALLSGGEQALTAVALLFALFLENPAPICVLDEVDAPLDDANVERFCDLLREVAGNTATRFLVVTHNPVTMASMDRLYGVTMGEPGVSQLVSVDLAAAEALIAAA